MPSDPRDSLERACGPAGEMSGIDEDEASEIHAKQAKRKQGFGHSFVSLENPVESMIEQLPLWERDSPSAPVICRPAYQRFI